MLTDNGSEFKNKVNDYHPCRMAEWYREIKDLLMEKRWDETYRDYDQSRSRETNSLFLYTQSSTLNYIHSPKTIF